MTADNHRKTPDASLDAYDVAIVGAGFAGLYMLHKVRQMGMTARVFEAGNGVGGTWFWNRYPGARCDIESMEYSYQFSDELAQEWEWSERYATQAEILRYIDHVAERFDLSKDIQLETRVESATFIEADNRWLITTASVAEPVRTTQIQARFCVMATGCLSSANVPDFKGLENFKGQWYHTGNWPQQGVDFSGKRVGMIGTGSSAIQSTPLIAEQAEHLTIFQRTPNYSIPAHNQPHDPQRVASVKKHYREFREQNKLYAFGADFDYNEANAVDVTEEERIAEYEARWERGGLPFLAAFADLIFDEKANETAASFLRGKIRGIVKNPETAQLLCPDTVVGCKRLCVDSGYFESFNRDNVTLVDVSTIAIEEITESGLRTADKEYNFDVLVFATGFDAMTGALLKVKICGRDGQTLQDKWCEGPKTYLGLTTSGFPNLFTITGPGSPSVLTNMLPSIEQHVEFIADCIEHMRDVQAATIEPSTAAEEDWGAHVNEVANESLYPNCNSWYLGANVPGKPRVFMPYLGFPAYVEKCQQVVAEDYQGFELKA